MAKVKTTVKSTKPVAKVGKMDQKKMTGTNNGISLACKGGKKKKG